MLTYRADLDGLRAIAVAAVVLFHAEFQFWEGGFVGVDVFFVISGFLITSIILKHEGSISSFFPSFYERRIRRLFPPLVPVLIFTSALAYVAMPPAALEEYAHSLMAFLAFVSNWFFWLISGYFDGPAQYKPLLHTWSLSIEEQFYILFPTIVLLLARRGRGYVALFFVAVLAASFAFSVYLVAIGNQSSAFFNSFSRFWEIALGSLLALGLVKSPSSEMAKGLLGGAGLLMIGLAVFTLDETSAFPGWNALLPTVGTAAIILANGGVIGRLLSVRPAVALGLISYSLYLWHWPIFVFINTYWIDATAFHFAVGIAAAILAATISYLYVETPVRRRRVFPFRRHAFSFFGVGASLLFIFGATGTATGGLPGRFSETELALIEDNPVRGIAERDGKSCSKRPVEQACVIGDPDVAPTWAILGDSHAETLTTALDETFRSLDEAAFVYTLPGCPFIVNVERLDTGAKCYEFVDDVFGAIERNGIERVLIQDRANAYIHGSRFDNGEGGVEPGAPVPVARKDADPPYSDRTEGVIEEFKGTLKRLLSLELEVFYFLPVPEVGWHAPQISLLRVRQGGGPVTTSFERYKERNAPLLDALSALTGADQLTIVPTYEPFCDERTGRCSVSGESGLFYTDTDHLSVRGAERLVGLFTSMLADHRRVAGPYAGTTD